MYNFHYDYMKKKYQENINLMYTDAFIYDIKTIDFYDDIRFEIDQHFDTSEYVADTVFNLPLINKKKLGMVKKHTHTRKYVNTHTKIVYKLTNSAGRRH